MEVSEPIGVGYLQRCTAVTVFPQGFIRLIFEVLRDRSFYTALTKDGSNR